MYIRKSYDVICECCGKQFIAHNTRTRYCSRRCKDIGYKRSKGQNSRLDPCHVKCAICGKEFDTFNQSKKTCSDECSKELRRRRDKARDQKRYKYKRRKRYSHTREEYENIRKANAEVRRIEKEWYRAIHTVERECKICGSLFYCLDTENKCTCSKECSKKYGNLKRDKRIPKEQKIDTISLKRLYKRDNGICYLCGELCDWDDWKISPKGNRYPGDKHPVIEHVIPVSKGGLDSWDNVRLACSKCNREKADGIIKIQPMPYKIAYSQKFSATQAKKTAQYTLDGKLIKIWDSTGQIERELGLRSKHIQDVCRRYNSNTGNAYGYHWEYVS